MTTTAPFLSSAAHDEAAELGRRMARKDSWICLSDDVDAEHHGADFSDYGQFQDAHRAGWEETCHFQELWLDEVIEISEADAEKQGVERLDNNMLWYEEFQVPAKTAMWEAWEEEKGMLEFWQQHYS